MREEVRQILYLREGYTYHLGDIAKIEGYD
jgi:hypothetical protein